MHDWLDQGCDVFAYFNNDHDGNAFFDARWLAAAVNRRDTRR